MLPLIIPKLQEYKAMFKRNEDVDPRVSERTPTGLEKVNRSQVATAWATR